MFCLLLQFFITDTKTNDDDDDHPESLWSNQEGNSQNTYRIVPSMAINYSKKPWIYEYSLTIQVITEVGLGAGINDDLYFFLRNTTGHLADFMACLTKNGVVRWELPVEPVAAAELAGASNIVSDRQGYLFYMVSWKGFNIRTAKICRITDAQTSNPVQRCIF